MADRSLVELRQAAERAVADMAEGDLKAKAFEVILSHLLNTEDKVPNDSRPNRPLRTASKGQRARTGNTTTERILALKAEDFFATLRTIGEVRDELASRGWHYPVTGLSGPLQELVQRRELRRQKVVDGKKKIYKYSNP